MGLAAEDILQIVPVVGGHGNGFPEDRLALFRNLIVNKAQGAGNLRCQPGELFVALLVVGVIVVHRDGQVAVVAGEGEQAFQFPQVVQAGVDAFRRVQFSFVILCHAAAEGFQCVHIGVHVFFGCVDGGQIPGEFPGDVTARF